MAYLYDRIRFLNWLVIFFCQGSLFAQDVKFFAENYLSLGLQSNLPTLELYEKYQQAYAHGSLEYINILQDEWWLSLSFGIKTFRQRQNHEILTIWTLSDSIYKVIRVHHPIYFLIGGNFLYMYPSEGVRAPPKKVEELDPEAGIAISFGMIYYVSKWLLVTAQAQRWRGVNSMRIHGYQFTLSGQLAI